MSLEAMTLETANQLKDHCWNTRQVMMRTERGQRKCLFWSVESGDQYEDSLQGERGESIEITFIKLGWSGIW